MDNELIGSITKIPKDLRIGRLRTNIGSSKSSGVLSPVTDLAVNLGCLSTGERKFLAACQVFSPQIDSTPKRRISWSGIDTPVKNLTSDTSFEGGHDDSLSESDSSFTISRPEKLNVLRVRRDNNSNDRNSSLSKSIPLQTVTMVQFDGAGSSPVFASKSISFGKNDEPALEGADENSPPFLQSPCKCAEATAFGGEESRDSTDSGYSCLMDNEEPLRKTKCSVHHPVSRTDSNKSSKVLLARNSLASMSSVFSSDSNHVFPENNGDDDGFSNVFQFDKYEDDCDKNTSKIGSSAFSSLLSDPLTTSFGKDPSPEKSKDPMFGVLRCRDNISNIKPSIRRCLSMKTEAEKSFILKSESPTLRGIFKSPSAPRLISSSSYKSTFKRPDPPKDIDLQSPAFKRRKSVTIGHGHGNNENGRLQRSHSETEATIMRALQLSTSDPNLIGDFSRPYILPLTKSRNQDVKCVSPRTVTELMDGVYGDEIDKFHIIDCRYPYEYEGGHIEGAQNIYTKDAILESFLSNQTKLATSNPNSGKRKVIIFHCEFSSERAPNMYRFLRNKDRDCNKECYPSLHHPELYVLKGGYKAFFESQMDKCFPKEYKPMVHKDHEDDLKHFRTKSKSWNNDNKNRTAVRPGLKF